jgi:hypothetical protein
MDEDGNKISNRPKTKAVFLNYGSHNVHGPSQEIDQIKV